MHSLTSAFNHSISLSCQTLNKGRESQLIRNRKEKRYITLFFFTFPLLHNGNRFLKSVFPIFTKKKLMKILEAKYLLVSRPDLQRNQSAIVLWDLWAICHRQPCWKISFHLTVPGWPFWLVQQTLTNQCSMSVVQATILIQHRAA